MLDLHRHEIIHHTARAQLSPVPLFQRGTDTLARVV